MAIICNRDKKNKARSVSKVGRFGIHYAAHLVRPHYLLRPVRPSAPSVCLSVPCLRFFSKQDTTIKTSVLTET